jgi:hypothetical protein
MVDRQELSMVSNATSKELWRTLDPGRIAGFAAAILINLVVVVALTMPVAPIYTPWANAPETDDYLHWVPLWKPLPPPRPIPVAECIGCG